MLYVIFFALLGALLVFFLIDGVGSLTVEHIYMSNEAVSARKAEIYSQFQSYVTDNAVAGTDSSAVARWTGENE